MREPEKGVLREAAVRSGMREEDATRFCEKVERRLRKGAEEYGELAYLKRTVSELLDEANEEQHDAGGWSSLALRRLDDAVERGFPRDIAELIRLYVLEGVAGALGSEDKFKAAIALYREHEHKMAEPEPPFTCSDERLSLS